MGFSFHTTTQLFLLLQIVVILLDLALIGLLWLSRVGFSDSTPGWQVLFAKYPGDGTVAIVGAMIMFIIPAFHPKAEPGQRILDWESVKDLPWGIIVLLGSGFAIARAFVVTGLSEWVGTGLLFLKNLPPFLMVVAVITIITWVTG